MDIRVDDLSGPEIADFLDEHLQEMRSISPPESTHALDLEGLKAPEITFWSVWDGERLIACGALKRLSAALAELKSMRTSADYRAKGVGSSLLRHILLYAKHAGYGRISLETGAMAYFQPARSLYEKFGFRYCAPFGTYRDDPNSVFMSLRLDDLPEESLARTELKATGNLSRRSGL